MLKAVLFDMDGVIIDSEPLHTKAFQDSMKQFGMDLTEEYCNQFIGRTDRYMAEVLIEEFQLQESVDTLLEAKNSKKRQYEKEIGYPAVPYVKELIMDLAENHIKLAIASSSPMEAIQETVKSLGLSEYFDQYISGMDLKHSKPAPDIFLKAASSLGVNPRECLVIEDSTHGIAAAKAADMTCIGFYNPNSGNQDLSKADIIIEGFDEINTAFLNEVYQHAHNEPVTIATCDHVILRELTLDDMKTLYEIYQQPDISTYVHGLDDYETELKKHEAYIKHVYHFYHCGYWGVFERKSNQLIGRCGIQYNEIDHKTELELSYLIDSNYTGNGLGYESANAAIQYAINRLGEKRIVAVIDSENTRSKKLATKLGMIYDKEVTYQNKKCELYVYQKTN